MAGVLAARAWLAAHPQHNPWAPLDLGDPPGWATSSKLVSLKEDAELCRTVLTNSEIEFRLLPPAGDGECLREDRLQLTQFPLQPQEPVATCAVAAGMEYWRRHSLDPVAQELFGTGVEEIMHLGTFSCRRLYGRSDGAFSEHATGNAIDISGFRLEDGTVISVLNDWEDPAAKGAFLRQVRDGACSAFATVLSPDYNAAHADHFHFDQASRWGSFCR
ncbi:extensin family protein [Porphyrobacter sp. GA68]|uniref:extensin-like domain-containing protein n=1 Tax=Porphyrobacter sp. GA68 TaxID=2883480 RepID=UPI001D182D2E|nr:extensin family protein [Porphyrobacter sp. GA68]